MTTRSLLALSLLVAPALAAAEGAGAPERLVVIVAPGTAEGEAAGEALVRVVRSYLSDVALDAEAVEAEIPDAPFEVVREAVRAVAAARGASFAVWSHATDTGEVVLWVMHLRGDTVLVRTIDLEHEPPVTLRRTVAAVVRSVVDTGFLEVAARAEQDPAPTRAPAASAPRSRERPAGPSRRWQLGLEGGYGFRWVASPGPMHQTASLAFRARALSWLGLRVAGRVGLVADPQNQRGGEVWRGALVVALGIDRPLGALAIGALAGADLEWIRGDVELGESRGARAFEGFGAGAMARVFLAVRVWRGLVLSAAVETTVRPQRTLYLVRGEPAASSGYVEVGLEIGLGWESDDL